MKIRCCALLAITSATSFWLGVTTLAMAAPLDRLASLTSQKGYVGTPFGTYLTKQLGVKEDSIVYQVPYDDGPVHRLCSVFRDHNATSEPWHVVLINLDEKLASIYLTDTNAHLIQFIKGQKPPGTDWKWTSVSVSQGAEGFKRELEYWRRQQDVLEAEPDRSDAK